MRTDLAQLFQDTATFADGKYVPFGPDTEKNERVDRFIARLKSSATSKLRSEVSTAADLFRHPKFALLMYDALVLYGVTIENQAKVRLDMWYEVGTNTYDQNGQRILQTEHPYPAYGYFDDDVLSRWTDEARPFIEEGRLIYVPKRMEIIIHAHPKGYASMQMVNVDYASPWAMWNGAIAAKREGAQTLLPETLPSMGQRFYEIISAALPFIDGIPLNLLHQVMSEEDDALVHFRKAIGQAIQQSYLDTKGDDDPKRLQQVGARVGHEMIEPELAKLNLQLRKIIQTRSIRMAGAVLGTAALCFAAIPAAGVAAILASTLGAGGLGLLAKEVAEYRAEIMSLEENPWYFAWKLKRAA